MRSMMSSLAVLGFSVLVFACHPHDSAVPDSHSAKPPPPEAAAAATASGRTGISGGKMCLMQLSGHNVLKLTIPDGASCKSFDGGLDLDISGRRVQVRVVRGAKTVDEAAARVPTEIASEFKDFQSTDTKTITVAGTPAIRMNGTGVEADDGDPGKASVAVFKAGPHVFIACTHGENLDAADTQRMMTVVESAAPGQG